MAYCTRPNCNRLSVARGICHRHYQAAHREGSALPPRTKAEDGAGFLGDTGYRAVYKNGKRKAQHIFVAESALGRCLPSGAVVHHVNENRDDNRNVNLVICESSAYHLYLHRRVRALRECGNANFLKCSICKQFDDPGRLVIFFSNGAPRNQHHRQCWNLYHRALRRKYRKVRADGNL